MRLLLPLLCLVVISTAAPARMLRVERGPVERVLVEAGDVQAVRSRDLVAPGDWRAEALIVELAPEGTRVAAGDTLVREVDAGRHLRVSLRGRSRPGIRFSNRGPSWSLGLNRDLPIRLDVRSEVADATLDLRGTRVHALNAHAEVGRQTIYLPDGDVDAVVGSEVGRVEVFVPRDANVRVTVREGMRVVRADPAFQRAWRGYELTGGGASIDLQIRSSLGDVALRTY